MAKLGNLSMKIHQGVQRPWTPLEPRRAKKPINGLRWSYNKRYDEWFAKAGVIECIVTKDAVDGRTFNAAIRFRNAPAKEPYAAWNNGAPCQYFDIARKQPTAAAAKVCAHRYLIKLKAALKGSL